MKRCLRLISSVVVLAFTITSIGTVPLQGGSALPINTKETRWDSLYKLSPQSRFKAVADAKQTLPAKRYVGARRIEMGRARRALGVFIGLGAIGIALAVYPAAGAALAMAVPVGRLYKRVVIEDSVIVSGDSFISASIMVPADNVEEATHREIVIEDSVRVTREGIRPATIMVRIENPKETPSPSPEKVKQVPKGSRSSQSSRTRGAGLIKVFVAVAALALALAYPVISAAADSSQILALSSGTITLLAILAIVAGVGIMAVCAAYLSRKEKPSDVDKIKKELRNAISHATAKEGYAISLNSLSVYHELETQYGRPLLMRAAIEVLTELAISRATNTNTRRFAIGCLGGLANELQKRFMGSYPLDEGHMGMLLSHNLIIDAAPALEAALKRETDNEFKSRLGITLVEIQMLKIQQAFAPSPRQAEVGQPRQSGRTLLGLAIGASILIVGLGILFWYHPQPQQPSQAPTTQPIQQPIPKEAPASGNPLEGIIRLNRILMDPAATPLERYHALQELEEDPSAGALVPILIEVASEPNSPIIDYPELEDGRLVERHTSLSLLAIKTLERIIAPSEVKIRALEKIAERNPNDILILTRVREAIERLRHTGTKPKGAKQTMRIPQLHLPIPLTEPQLAGRRSP